MVQIVQMMLIMADSEAAINFLMMSTYKHRKHKRLQIGCIRVSSLSHALSLVESVYCVRSFVPMFIRSYALLLCTPVLKDIRYNLYFAKVFMQVPAKATLITRRQSSCLNRFNRPQVMVKETTVLSYRV